MSRYPDCWQIPWESLLLLFFRRTHLICIREIDCDDVNTLDGWLSCKLVWVKTRCIYFKEIVTAKLIKGCADCWLLFESWMKVVQMLRNCMNIVKSYANGWRTSTVTDCANTFMKSVRKRCIKRLFNCWLLYELTERLVQMLRSFTKTVWLLYTSCANGCANVVQKLYESVREL